MATIGSMKRQFQRGQIVKVKAYGGEMLERRVVADLGRTVVICNEEEYQTANRGGRQPEGVGFPRADILQQAESAPERSTRN